MHTVQVDVGGLAHCVGASLGMRLRCFQGVDLRRSRQSDNLPAIVERIRRTARPWTMVFDAPAAAIHGAATT